MMQRRDALGGLAAAAGSALLPEPSAAGEQTPTPKNLPTERVTGIGGVFFRERQPVIEEQGGETRRTRIGETCDRGPIQRARTRKKYRYRSASRPFASVPNSSMM